MPSTLQACDYTLLAVGTACLLAWALHLAASGRWRDPLADAPLPAHGPNLTTTFLLLLAFFYLPVLFAGLALLLVPDEQSTSQPGSPAWHFREGAATVGRLLLCALMLAVLARQHGLTREFSLPTRDTRPQPLPRRLGRAMLGGTAAMLVLLPLVTVQLKLSVTLWRWAAPTTPPEHPVLETLTQTPPGVWGTLHLLFGAAVLAPLTEELLFRGFLLTAVSRLLQHRWLAIAISALFFGLVHLFQPQAVLPLITMGLILGYVRLRTGSLIPCIVAHVLFNARTLLFALLAPDQLNQA